MMSFNKNAIFAGVSPVWALGGGLFLSIAIVRLFSLDRGGIGTAAVLAAAFLALAALSIWLLSRCGHARNVLRICFFFVGLALLARVLLLDHVTLDFEWFLEQWVTRFRAGGGFAAVDNSIGNYNVPYLYFLAAISYLDLPELYLIKLFSILFDVLLAWGGMRVVLAFPDADSARGAAVFCALLLLPTVVLNGACWAQCDAIYGAFVLHAVACALKKQPAASVVLLAVAFSFKLQAIFIVPLWCVLWFTGRVSFRRLLLFPATYILTILPALLLGKPLADILNVYINQAGSQAEHKYLNYNSASIFNLIPRGLSFRQDLAAKISIVCAFLLVALLLLFLFLSRRSVGPHAILTAAAALCVGIPFLLPYMHDRYFFLADILLVVWSGVNPRRTWIAVLEQTASLGGYCAYLTGRYAVPLRLFSQSFPMGLESLFMLLTLFSVIAFLPRETQKAEIH